jgi:hypothetical protein
MRYMLLIYGCERYLPGTEDYQTKVDAVREFTRHCRDRGVLLGADPLHPTDTATTVRVRQDEVLVTDGPFAETAEHLGGYFLLDCRDLDEALELAARCPMAAEGSVEVRPIMELPPDAAAPVADAVGGDRAG